MASESRRSTAAQFFMEEEVEALEELSTYDRVVELLNQASLQERDAAKVTNLKKVQELIIHKEPNLLDNFLEEMFAFMADKSVDVKKFVIGFMEEACKKDNEILEKVVGNLSMLLQDENVNIQKRVILSMAGIFKQGLQWLAKAKKITDTMQTTWQYIITMKARITDMLDSENDGIRTHSIKFMEGLVFTLSKRMPDSEIPKMKENDMTIDQIPDEHPKFKVKKLEEEGRSAFEQLLVFQASAHISSVNLMTCMTCLTNLAKQRPQFISRVIQGFEALHVNLPPTLAKSQVSSVRKHLKIQMLQLLRHPASYDYHTQITTLLTDLGATQSEVVKNLPKNMDKLKRKAEDTAAAAAAAASSAAKKIKLEAKDDEDDGGTSPLVTTESKTETDQQSTAIDVTATDLIPNLTPENVADLVLLSMVMLPDTMPATFQATYTPIAAAGTEAQIKHCARLLATQLTIAGIGKGVLESKGKDKSGSDVASSPTYGGLTPWRDDAATSKHAIHTVVGGATKENQKPKIVAPQQPVKKGIKHFKLSNITHRMDVNELERMAQQSFKRVLDSEKSTFAGNASAARTKILSGLVSQFSGLFKTELQDYIFADLRNRADLAFAWLYQEYANYQGYNLSSVGPEKPTIGKYDDCLTRLLTGLLERPDQREGLFSRLLLEAPCITPNAVQVLRRYCQDETRIYLGMTTLKELILKRPNRKLEFLEVLLDFAAHEKADVRNNAIRVTKGLYDRKDMREAIQHYATIQLNYLLLAKPPADLFAPGRSKHDVQDVWTEETIKLCLYLYLGLMPVDHQLIHELAKCFTAAPTADIKRTILRMLESPVKGMGMESPQLLLLVENCPKGAETFITRVIHILTDKVAPSPRLVGRVRDLYHKRVADVRFLIPVLTGLTKKEVVSALPKLIKLNPVVVKEVFNRLLGGHGDDSYSSPLSPADLLVTLHNIDPQKCDMKTIIKATNLCFSEKQVYTQEVLAVVMQQLMEQNPLPTLLMRTVIQSLSMNPRLMGFVMNILQRLITKQVWKQKKVWEGFIKCCQRTKPQSFQVLLQLPPAQLANVFQTTPDLWQPLHNHVSNLTSHQRAHIPGVILQMLERDPQEADAPPPGLEDVIIEKVQEARAPPMQDKMKAMLEKEKQERQRAAELAKVKIKVEPGLEPLPTQQIQTIQTIGQQIQTVGSRLQASPSPSPSPSPSQRGALGTQQTPSQAGGTRSIQTLGGGQAGPKSTSGQVQVKTEPDMGDKAPSSSTHRDKAPAPPHTLPVTPATKATRDTSNWPAAGAGADTGEKEAQVIPTAHIKREEDKIEQPQKVSPPVVVAAAAAAVEVAPPGGSDVEMVEEGEVGDTEEGELESTTESTQSEEQMETDEVLQSPQGKGRGARSRGRRKKTPTKPASAPTRKSSRKK